MIEQLGVEREADGDDDALAHAARELVRIVAEPVGRDADQREQLRGARPRLPRATCPVWVCSTSWNWLSMRQHRVQRVHRALEHHRHLAPAQLVQRLRRRGRARRAVEQDLAARADERRRAVQAADGEGDGALAAAGFAGEPEELAAADVEAHVLDGVEDRSSAPT